MKVIKYLQNRRLLMKGTTTKTISQEGGFLNFFRPLMTAGLSLIKNVLSLLAECVFFHQDYQQECHSYSK